MPSKPPWPDALPTGWRRQAEGLMAGVDEAGRGPLAGPVVAAAVLLDARRPIAGLADSKLLAPAVRERLHDEIVARALCVSVAEASVEEIDRLNILHATLLAMRRAVEGLRLRPLRVLVDGDRLPALALPMDAIVGGDARVRAISAASIVAKVHRDRLCLALHERHPQYGFDRHKGYPSPAHLAALREHGACEVHRRSYAPVRDALAACAAMAAGDAAVGASPQPLHATAPDDTRPGDVAPCGDRRSSPGGAAAAPRIPAGASGLHDLVDCRCGDARTTPDARTAMVAAAPPPGRPSDRAA